MRVDRWIQTACARTRGVCARTLGRRSPYGAAALALALIGPAQAAAAQRRGGRRPTHVVRIVARDFAFNMSDTLRAGLTTLRLRNDGQEPHHVMLFRLDAGRGLSDVSAALARDGAYPAWMHATGGPNAVIGPRQSVVTLVLVPGTYVAFCFIPSPDRVLHFAKGMLKLLTVLPTADPPAMVPRGDVTITLKDYGFKLSRPLTPGPHRIAVVNQGKQAHELILSRLAPGKSTVDFVRWIELQAGPPPVEPYGGVTDIPPGATVVFDVDLTPGRYSLLCRVRDAVDGQPHDRHGMTADIVVKG